METTKQQRMQKSIEIDMERIREELAEQEMIQGAYCQEYDIFKIIYRFVARRLKRTRGSAYIILLTLSDSRGELPALADRQGQMAALRDLIQKSIRSGDVFTKYSSCQFLIMVQDLSEENADQIARRIEEAFEQRMGEEAGQVLLHHCYPMKAANTGEEKADT